MMEVDDWLACQVHGVCVSDSDSDDSYGKGEFDEEYYQLKPPAFCYESIKDNIIFISSEEVKEIKRKSSVTSLNKKYGSTKFKAANNTKNINNKKKKTKLQNTIEEKFKNENLRASDSSEVSKVVSTHSVLITESQTSSMTMKVNPKQLCYNIKPLKEIQVQYNKSSQKKKKLKKLDISKDSQPQDKKYCGININTRAELEKEFPTLDEAYENNFKKNDKINNVKPVVLNQNKPIKKKFKPLQFQVHCTKDVCTEINVQKAEGNVKVKDINGEIDTARESLKKEKKKKSKPLHIQVHCTKDIPTETNVQKAKINVKIKDIKGKIKTTNESLKKEKKNKSKPLQNQVHCTKNVPTETNVQKNERNVKIKDSKGEIKITNESLKKEKKKFKPLQIQVHNNKDAPAKTNVQKAERNVKIKYIKGEIKTIKESLKKENKNKSKPLQIQVHCTKDVPTETNVQKAEINVKIKDIKGEIETRESVKKEKKKKSKSLQIQVHCTKNVSTETNVQKAMKNVKIKDIKGETKTTKQSLKNENAGGDTTNKLNICMNAQHNVSPVTSTTKKRKSKSKKSVQELQNASTKIKEKGIEKVSDQDSTITISKKTENLFNNDDGFRNFVENIVREGTDSVDISSFTEEQLYTVYTIHTTKNNVAQEKGLSKEKNKLSQKNKKVKKEKKGKQKVTLNIDLGDIPHQNTTKIDKSNISINKNLDTTETTLKKYCYLFNEEIKYFIQDIINFGNSDINSFIFKRLCKDHMTYQQIMEDNKNINEFKNGETNNGGINCGDILTNMNSMTYGDTSTAALKKFNYLFDEEFAGLIKDISYFHDPNVIAFIYVRLCGDCMAYHWASRNYNIINYEESNNEVNHKSVSNANCKFLLHEEVQSIVKRILSFGNAGVNTYIYEGFYKNYLNKNWINRNRNLIKNEKTHNGTVGYNPILTNSPTIASLKRYDYLFDEEFEEFMMNILNFQEPNINYFIFVKLYGEYMAYKEIIRNCDIKHELYLKNQLFAQNSFLLQLLMSDVDINPYLCSTSMPYVGQNNLASPTRNSTAVNQSCTSHKTPQRHSNNLFDEIQSVCWEFSRKILENMILQTLSQLF